MTKATGYGVELETKVEVIFHDPEKTKAYFIDGKWRESFFDHDDLEALAEGMAVSFAEEGEIHKSGVGFCRELEGYGPFVLKEDQTGWLHPQELWEMCGKIEIRIVADLDHNHTAELEAIDQ